MAISQLKALSFRLCWLVVLLAAGRFATPARAEGARVVTIQRVGEKRLGTGTVWGQAKEGTGLLTGDAFRTGKRSKADIKFGDGSLIRLGQLSQLQIGSAKESTLSQGQLLFAMLRPGRILAGSAAAEIKGSVGIVQALPGGRARIVLYSGIVDVVTSLRTVRLKPGQQVEVSKIGEIGPLQAAAPLAYAGGRLYPELTDPPSHAPYVGSDNHTQDRSFDDRKSVDESLTDIKVSVGSQFNPIVPPTGGGGPDLPIDQPFPTPTAGTPPPFPTVPPPAGIAAPLRLAANQPETAFASSQPAGLQFASNLLEGDTSPVLNRPAPRSHYVRAITVALQQEPGPESIDLSIRAAENHIQETNLNLGYGVGGDARLLGALADGGSRAYGARLHGYAARGHWFLDAAFTPQRIAINGPNGRTRQTITPVSDATLTYRNWWGDVQLGRQRFLSGPMQASLFGSLVRQGGREIMDGVRLTPKLGTAGKLDVAYLYDAFPRDLPYRVSGPQHGYYGRYSYESDAGNFGVNLLRYTSVSNSTTGASVDFGVPLVRNQLELYGEFGRDNFRRKLASGGLYFPGLYQKTDIDAYLEYAHLGDSDDADGPPDELALRLYRRVNKNVDLMGTLSHFRHGDSSVILGLSVGSAIERE